MKRSPLFALLLLLGVTLSAYAQDTTPTAETGAEAKTKIVFIAGFPSHPPGEHEHRAGCMLLADALNKNVPGVDAQVSFYGWPKDESILEGAKAVVIYSDGGMGHPAMRHVDELQAMADAGVGIVCIHYAVEVPKGEVGNRFLDWIGGYFETDWSVNPHWDANYESFPEHPVTRGVDPFELRDEWYYHMRFREGMEGVTPVLTDLPPAESLSRPDGPHEGNPAVREAVAKGEPQHMAWAAERPDGGRGFGFTGGHFHKNWANDSMRTLMLNAILWAAKVEVPENGVKSATPTEEEMQANLDRKGRKKD